MLFTCNFSCSEMKWKSWRNQYSFKHISITTVTENYQTQKCPLDVFYFTRLHNVVIKNVIMLLKCPSTKKNLMQCNGLMEKSWGNLLMQNQPLCVCIYIYLSPYIWDWVLILFAHKYAYTYTCFYLYRQITGEKLLKRNANVFLNFQ